MDILDCGQGINEAFDEREAQAALCAGRDKAISHLREENLKLLRLLKSVHMWFMEKAPEHYNGCGLWIDVDMTLRESEQPCCGRSLHDCDCEPKTQGKTR